MLPKINLYNLYILYSNIILDCGRVYNDGKTLINNGKTSHVGTAPWNVGIYKFNKESFMYDLICGGSIISPNLVVSGIIICSMCLDLRNNDNYLNKIFSGSLFLARRYDI